MSHILGLIFHGPEKSTVLFTSSAIISRRKKIDKVAGDVNKAINFRNISGLDTVQKWIPLEVGQNTLDN